MIFCKTKQNLINFEDLKKYTLYCAVQYRYIRTYEYILDSTVDADMASKAIKVRQWRTNYCTVEC